MNNYFLFLELYAVIITQITCINEVREHDLTNEDIRTTISHLVQDLEENTYLLLQRNLTIPRIDLKDDTIVEFKDIKFNKLLDSHASVKIVGKSNDYVKIDITLGSYKLEGSYKNLSNGNIYPFTTSMTVYAKIEMLSTSSHNIEENFKIMINTFNQEIMTNDSSDNKNNMIQTIFNNRLPSIESKILDQLFVKIEKHELLPYFSTLKNYFFPSKIDPTKQYYLINQTHVLSNPGLEPPYEKFITDWIKIENISPELSFNSNIDPRGTLFVFRSHSPMHVRFSGYYAGNGTNLKKPSEHRIQIKHSTIRVLQAPLGYEQYRTIVRDAPVYIQLGLLEQSDDSDTRTWFQRYKEQMEKIICDDWKLLLERRNVDG